MCVGDAAAETHLCSNVCPVCYIFTPENAIQLLSGKTIELGTLDLVIEVGQIGCRMCQMLCNMWELNQEVLQHIVHRCVLQLTDYKGLSIWS